MKAATKKADSHAGKAKLTFWLDGGELTKLDKEVEQRGYLNRSEWLRDMVRKTVRGEV